MSRGRPIFLTYCAHGPYGKMFHVEHFRDSFKSLVIRHHASFFSTSAEFFDPNPTQLQIAFSICAMRPAFGM